MAYPKANLKSYGHKSFPCSEKKLRKHIREVFAYSDFNIGFIETNIYYPN
jgi:hypothetical protein